MELEEIIPVCDEIGEMFENVGGFVALIGFVVESQIVLEAARTDEGLQLLYLCRSTLDHRLD